MAEHYKSFKKNTIVYSIGNLSIFVIKFFLVPIYTFYISQKDMGVLDLLSSTAPVLAVIFGFQIEMSILRWMLEKPDKQLEKKVFTNSFLILLAGIFLFFLAYIIFVFVGKFNFFDILNPWLVLAYIYSLWIYTFLKQSIRSMYSSKAFVVTDIIYTISYLLLVICFLTILHWGIEAILIAQIISVFGLFIYWFIIQKMFAFINIKYISKKMLSELLRYSMPLIPNSINLWGINTLVKYLILFFLGVASNGIFAVSFKIAFVIQMINGIFNMAWQDKAIASFNDNNFTKEVNQYFTKVFAIYSSATLLLISSQKVLVYYMIDQDYWDASNYIWILALGFLFMGLSSFLGVIYQCQKRTWPISFSSILGSLILLIIGYFIVPQFKLYGASVAFLVGNFAMFVYRFLDVKTTIHLHLPIIQLTLFLMVCGLLVYLNQSQQTIFYVLAIFVAVFYTIYVNKELLIQNIKKIKT